jgi:DNA-binding CsgD family transcriptional regulator
MSDARDAHDDDGAGPAGGTGAGVAVIGGATGRFTWVDERFGAMHSMPGETLVGSNCLIVVAPSSLVVAREAATRARSDGRSSCRLMHVDATSRPFEVDIELVAVGGTPSQPDHYVCYARPAGAAGRVPAHGGTSILDVTPRRTGAAPPDGAPADGVSGPLTVCLRCGCAHEGACSADVLLRRALARLRELEDLFEMLTVASRNGSPDELPLPATRGSSRLTSREREVLHLLLDNLRAPAIGRELHLSASAVRNHLSSIYRKHGVSSQAELVDLLRSRRQIEKSSVMS